MQIYFNVGVFIHIVLALSINRIFKVKNMLQISVYVLMAKANCKNARLIGLKYQQSKTWFFMWFSFLLTKERLRSKIKKLNVFHFVYLLFFFRASKFRCLKGTFKRSSPRKGRLFNVFFHRLCFLIKSENRVFSLNKDNIWSLSTAGSS